MSKKLLIVTHCFPSNKDDLVGNFLHDFTKYLSKLGYSVTIFSPKMNKNYDMVYQNQYVNNIELFGWSGGEKRLAEFKILNPKDLMSLFSLFKNGKQQLNKLLKKENYDFILAPWVVPSGYIVTNVAKKHNIPFGVWTLGSDINVYGKKLLVSNLINKVLHKANHTFTNNFQMQKSIKEKYGIKPTILFTNRKLSKPTSSYEKTNTFKILFIGRLEFVKGPDILLKALLQSNIQNFSLKLIGDGSMRKELELFVDSNNLKNKILFFGQQGKEIISNEIIQSDYLIISSRSEGMPVVFWEAMQMNTPVLSTDCGDIRYYCEKYNVGRTCNISEKALSELISFASNFKPLRETLSENTNKLAELTNIKSSAIKFDNIITKEILS